MKKFSLLVLLLLVSFQLSAQVDYFPQKADSITQNANAIISQSKEIVIESIESYTVKTTRKVWVLNELGLSKIDAYELYGNNESIKQIQATIYSSYGQEIQKFKRKDFTDESVSGSSLITDNRVLSLDYVPKSYPFYIVYESETRSKNTAFIPAWFPLEDYNCAIIKSTITVKWPIGVNFKYKIYNENLLPLNKNISDNELSFSVENSKAYKSEPLSISFRDWSPNILFGLDEFYLEGLKGTAKSWEEFGNWMNQQLINNTTELPEATIQKMKTLTDGEKDNLAKAKKIYEYVQNKTHYVSIQLGIGGWKPMLAKDVDRLGYGDCKALTNYTRALLKSVNIPSYYTIVYGGDKRSLHEDFVSMQGNHVILGIPNNNDIVWLECTSQSLPFGFQGDFTNDRVVLAIDDDHSKLTKTKKFSQSKNLVKHISLISINQEGSVKGNIKVVSTDLQYNNRYVLEKLDPIKLTDAYKEFYTVFPNLKIEKNSFENNKEKVEFIENIDFQSQDLFRFKAEQVLVPINTINQFSNVPPRVRNRKLPFEIENSFTAEDEIQIEFEDNLRLSDFPKEEKVTSEFGEYTMQVEKKENGMLFYKRIFKLNEGIYPSEKYDTYRKFREQVAKLENVKMIINK